MKQGEPLPPPSAEQQKGLDALKACTGLARLTGGPGVGKSTLVKHLGNEIPLNMCATTNKAAKIIGGSTIHKLLALRVKRVQGKETLVTTMKTPRSPLPFRVLIDEGSMMCPTATQLVQRLIPKAILCGDDGQLNPVDCDYIPFMEVKVQTQVHLNKVWRFEGDILTTAYQMRDVIFGGSDGCSIPDKWMDKNFDNTIKDMGDDDVVIAWRNKTVNRYNRILQMHKYGTLDWVVGQKVRVGTFFNLPTGEQLPTEHEAIITGLDSGAIMGLRVWKVELDSQHWVPVVHDEDREAYDEQLSYLADMRQWNKFWPLKDMFCDLRPGHAITAHKSQGSTYPNVFVDYGDIFQNGNYIEAMRAAYVGTTRASNSVTAKAF